MKKVFFLILIVLSYTTIAQNVGINNSGTAPDANAMLDIAANDKGVLIPRLTAIQRDAIVSPPNSLIIYNTDCGMYNYYDCDTWRDINKTFDFPFMSGDDNIVYGKKTVSENETGVTYQVAPVSGATNYVWMTTTGGTIVSGQGTHKITVDFSTPGDGFVCVEIENQCNARVQSCLYIEVCSLPQVAGTIAGNTSPHENGVGETYSISAVPGADDYTWTVPGSATITSGQGTTSITVDFNGQLTAQDICVVANNDCGTGTPVCLSVTTTCPAAVAPTATAASNISQTTFDANWQAVSGAVTYYLDVSDDAGFSNLIVNNQNVGNVTSYNVSSGLTCNTSYYYRVRAENACGTGANSGTETLTTGSCWSCGDALTDTRDTKAYSTVAIGNQCWMAENLAYLPAVHSNSQFQTQGSNSQAGYGVYGYNGSDVTTAKSQANYTTYGVLYNWFATMDGSNSSNNNPSGVQGVCPTGWHLPSDAEWQELESYLGMPDIDTSATSWRGTDQGTQLKTSSWSGTNTSGFTALPGGFRDNTNGSFSNETVFGYWWSATESGSDAWWRALGGSDATVYRDIRPKELGYSVRCVKD